MTCWLSSTEVEAPSCWAMEGADTLMAGAATSATLVGGNDAADGDDFLLGNATAEWLLAMAGQTPSWQAAETTQ